MLSGGMLRAVDWELYEPEPKLTWAQKYLEQRKGAIPAFTQPFVISIINDAFAEFARRLRNVGYHGAADNILAELRFKEE